MTKIYTRTGDAGETSLLGGRRVRKDDLRIETIGDVDEVNAVLGVVRMELARSGAASADVDVLLSQIQHRLFDIGAELAMSPAERSAGAIGDVHVAALEEEIDRHDAKLAPLRAFILPGGTPAAAQLHLARCVCRRAERRLVELSGTESVRGQLLRYLNRLSDLLFVLARVVNQVNQVPDVIWEQGAGGGEQGASQRVPGGEPPNGYPAGRGE
jgi:cob(I)alamin adenosyltransferase